MNVKNHSTFVRPQAKLVPEFGIFVLDTVVAVGMVGDSRWWSARLAKSRCTRVQRSPRVLCEFFSMQGRPLNRFWGHGGRDGRPDEGRWNVRAIAGPTVFSWRRELVAGPTAYSGASKTIQQPQRTYSNHENILPFTVLYCEGPSVFRCAKTPPAVRFRHPRLTSSGIRTQVTLEQCFQVIQCSEALNLTLLCCVHKNKVWFSVFNSHKSDMLNPT